MRIFLLKEITMIITKFYIKNFNPELLREQLDNFLPGKVSSLLWAGFDLINHRYQPIVSTKVIATTIISGVLTNITAEPGEVQFTVPEDFTISEEATLDTILTNHNSTQVTQEQQRQIQDLNELQQIRDLYDLPSLTANQLTTLVKLLARRILREHRQEAI